MHLFFSRPFWPSRAFWPSWPYAWKTARITSNNIPAPSKCSRICVVSGFIAFSSSCQLFLSASDFAFFHFGSHFGWEIHLWSRCGSKDTQECSNHNWDAVKKHDETGVPESLFAETMENHFKPQSKWEKQWMCVRFQLPALMAALSEKTLGGTAGMLDWGSVEGFRLSGELPRGS